MRGNARLTSSGFLIAQGIIAVLVLGLPTAAATGLVGTWRLVDISIDRVRWQAGGGTIIQTERPKPETFEEWRTIELDSDAINVVTKRRLPPSVSTDQYWLDDLPHTFEWGDTIPRETAVRTGRWIQDADGFEVTELYRGIEVQRHRWTLSPDGGRLTIESIYDRRCPPCAPGVARIIHVFMRQP